eukprot:2957764-Lingulodinium_polyedra.AAC.1
MPLKCWLNVAGCNLNAVRWLFRGCLVAAWWLFGGRLVAVWWLFGGCLVLPRACLNDVRKLLEYGLHAV